MSSRVPPLFIKSNFEYLKKSSIIGANPQGIKSCEPIVKGINNPEKLKSYFGDPLESLNTKKQEP